MSLFQHKKQVEQLRKEAQAKRSYKQYESMDLLNLVKQLPVIDFSKELWTYTGQEKLPNGAMTIGYYNYDQSIDDYFSYMYKLNLIDQNYLDNNNAIKNTPEKYNEKQEQYIYDNLTIEELLTVMTFRNRGERFFDGSMAMSIKYGEFKEIYDRIRAFGLKN